MKKLWEIEIKGGDLSITFFDSNGAPVDFPHETSIGTAMAAMGFTAEQKHQLIAEMNKALSGSGCEVRWEKVGQS